MDKILVEKGNLKLVLHEDAYYLIYIVDETANPLAFPVSAEDAEAVMKDADEIFEMVVKYRGKALCCETWSLQYNHGE